jgi:hypothetical protein
VVLAVVVMVVAVQMELLVVQILAVVAEELTILLLQAAQAVQVL